MFTSALQILSGIKKVIVLKVCGSEFADLRYWMSTAKSELIQYIAGKKIVFSNVDTASRIRISGTDNGGPTLSGNGRNLQISGDGPIEIASMVVEIRERDGTIKGPYSVINLRITGFSVVCTQGTKRLHWDRLRCGVIAERGQNKATDVTVDNFTCDPSNITESISMMLQAPVSADVPNYGGLHIQTFGPRQATATAGANRTWAQAGQAVAQGIYNGFAAILGGGDASMYDQTQTAQTVTYHAGSLRVSTQATNAPIISVNRFDQNVVEVILHPDAPHVVVNLGPLFETVQRLLGCAWNAITQRIHIHFQMTGDQQNPNFTVFWSNSNLITAANAVGHIDQQINTTYQAQDDFKKAVCRFYFDVINGAQ